MLNYFKMDNLDKKSNKELLDIKSDLTEKFHYVKSDIIKLYDFWCDIQSKYKDVIIELRKRGLQ